MPRPYEIRAAFVEAIQLNPTGLRFDPAAPSVRNYIYLQFTTIPNPISFGASSTTADGDGGLYAHDDDRQSK